MIVQDMEHVVFMDIGQSIIRDPLLFGELNYESRILILQKIV